MVFNSFKIAQKIATYLWDAIWAAIKKNILEYLETYKSKNQNAPKIHHDQVKIYFFKIMQHHIRLKTIHPQIWLGTRLSLWRRRRPSISAAFILQWRLLLVLLLLLVVLLNCCWFKTSTVSCFLVLCWLSPSSWWFSPPLSVQSVAYNAGWFHHHHHRVGKCHGYDGYIRVKRLASWGKKFGRPK